MKLTANMIARTDGWTISNVGMRFAERGIFIERGEEIIFIPYPNVLYITFPKEKEKEDA